MNFAQAIACGFQQLREFYGRASRSEFWYWVLFSFLVSRCDRGCSIYCVPSITGISPGNRSPLALLSAGSAVDVRRLHDIDRTGWWLVLSFTIIGGLCCSTGIA